MSEEYPVRAAAEIAVDESGEVLWVERYIFKRMHGPGETFVKDSRTYEVIASSITHGKHGGALVEHVCRIANGGHGAGLMSISHSELERLRAIEAAAKKFDEAGSTVNQMSREQWNAYTDLKALFHGGVKFRI